jgi:hypothetical protein
MECIARDVEATQVKVADPGQQGDGEARAVSHTEDIVALILTAHE